MDTWSIREDAFYTQAEKSVPPSLKQIRSQETVFTIGNGYFCTRGTFEEGYPHATPATLLYGVFDDVPIAKEELANTPDWTTIKLFINGQRFRLDRGNVLDYQRALDLRNGVLRRTVRWESPMGVRVQISAERFANLADVHSGAERYTVSVEEAPGEPAVDILLFAGIESGQGNYNLSHWETRDQGHVGEAIWLLSETKMSQVELAQTMSFDLTTPELEQTFKKEVIDSDLAPGIRLIGSLVPGATLVAEKSVVMYTSRDGNAEIVTTALAHLELLRSASAPDSPLYERLLAENSRSWKTYWDVADVVLEGDEQAQLGLRYSLYQLRINVLPGDSRYSIAAKGLTGFGYRGHIFHDTEIYMLPFFTYVLPDIARDLLLYRYHLLPAARAKAARGGYQGAQYPWESTLSGEEVTPTSIIHPETGEVIPVLNGTLELHITANIAHATWEYYRVSGDEAFLRDYGAEILLSTAQYWASRVTVDKASGEYVIMNVIGPDEWHEHVNNNTYTNALARNNLEIALLARELLLTQAPANIQALQEKLGLNEQDFLHWREIIQHIRILQDPQSGLIEQFQGFFSLSPLDQSKYAGRTKSYQALLGMKEVQDHQIVKQADVLMLLITLIQEFTASTKKVNWDYYYPITDHDYGSSLTPALHVILACEVGDREAAHDLFLQGALVDLKNLRGNTSEGIHAACAGAVWQAAIFGVAGLRVTDEGYTTSPVWPTGWTRLAFSFMHKGQRIHIDLHK
jgi:kojibiose phosphorylase